MHALAGLLAAWPGGEADLRHPLPGPVQDLLARAGRRRGDAAKLERLLCAAGPLLSSRGSERALVATLLSPHPEHLPLHRAAATLLALRPLARPDPVLRRLELVAAYGKLGSEALPHGEWERLPDYLLALIATDNTATLPLQRGVMAACLEAGGEVGQQALFLCVFKLLQHRLLEYRELVRAVVEGGALAPATYCGRRVAGPCYHPVLDYCGISAPPYFRLMYHRLVHELAGGEVLAGWEQISWIRRYPGAGYLRRALHLLASAPSLEALHMARWAADLEDEEYLPAVLRAQPAPLLYLLSLVRRDLDRQIARALEDEGYEAGLRWLRLPGPQAWRQIMKDAPLREWLAAHGEMVAGTVKALSCFKPPASARTRLAEVFQQEVAARLPGYPEQEQQRLLCACLHEHITGELPVLLANMELVRAVRNKGVRGVEQRAQEGKPAAIRALALYEQPYRDRFVPLLLRLRRSGNPMAARAAEEALELVAARCGVGSVQALEERFELQLAWEDAGLQGGPSRVWWSAGGCRLKLAVTAGRATITAYGPRGPRRSIPAAVRAHPDFAEVKAARRQLQTAYAHFRDRLEEAMISGRWFTPEHLRLLLGNGVFRDLAARLVLEGENGFQLGDRLQGRGRIRVVHPVSLLASGVLRQWQDYLAEHAICQPFKQCFREVYLPEPGERESQECIRFAGYPLIARKAFALLRARGYRPRSGEARRDWPDRGITACLVWAAEGPEQLHRHLVGEKREEPVTSGAIWFMAMGAEHPLPLGQVDAVVFSETLREADLLVATAGAAELGFSSRQTLQFRAAMLRQLARILKQWNIYVSDTGSHALVQGALATYRVHLGSGTVFLEPEGRSITVPVAGEAQELPLEGVDRGTARILLVVLSLARDTEIKLPGFREQLAGVAPGQPAATLPAPPPSERSG